MSGRLGFRRLYLEDRRDWVEGVDGRRRPDLTSSGDSGRGARPDELLAEAREDSTRLRLISEEMLVLSARRQAAVRALRDRFGWSHQQVADALGVSRGQAQSIYEGRTSSGRTTRTTD